MTGERRLIDIETFCWARGLEQGLFLRAMEALMLGHAYGRKGLSAYLSITPDKAAILIDHLANLGVVAEAHRGFITLNPSPYWAAVLASNYTAPERP